MSGLVYSRQLLFGEIFLISLNVQDGCLSLVLLFSIPLTPMPIINFPLPLPPSKLDDWHNYLLHQIDTEYQFCNILVKSSRTLIHTNIQYSTVSHIQSIPTKSRHLKPKNQIKKSELPNASQTFNRLKCLQLTKHQHTSFVAINKHALSFTT